MALTATTRRKPTVRELQLRQLPSGNRYIVKWWDPFGVEHSRSFQKKVEAGRLQRKLKDASEDFRVRWDRETGLPVELATQTGETWWSFVSGYLDRQRKRGRTRVSTYKSLHEGLTVATLVFTDRRRPLSIDQARKISAYVLDIVSASAEAIGERHEEARQLLAHRSLPLFEIDQGVIDELDAALLHTTPPELHLTAAGKKFDGDEGAVRLVGPIPCAPNYEIRRRAVVRQVLNDAVRRGKLGANPLTSVRSEERTEHPEASQVTPSQVPSPTQIRQIAEKIATGAKSKHYAGLVKMIGLAGPRPSECFRLEWGHLTLPEDGTWGNASITGGTVQPGRRWTGTGTPYKDEALKTKRNKNATRDVPIPPEVVADLLALRESRPDVKFNDRIFVDAKGGIPHEGNLNRLLHRVMTSLFPATPLEKLSLYGLRHSAATTYLNAGVPIHTAARYMGHSPEVMLRIYAACMPDTLQRATDLMDVELAR